MQWKELLAGKFFDLIVVIAGITIAFQVDSWKVASDQKSLERFYLESMARDLRQDIETLEGNLRILEADRKLAMSLRSQMSSHSALGDSLAVKLIDVFGFETFATHSNTFEMLVNGNGLSALRDRATRVQVAEYYSKYFSIRRFEQVYTEVIIRAFEFFNPSVDMSNRKVVDPTVFNKHQSRNMLLIMEGQLTDGIESYQDALANARALMQAVENNLRN